MLELYHADGSVCAQKVRMTIFFKGIEWEDRRVNLDKGEQFAPAYRELNPKAVVPTLVHDGKVVRESTIICEYLDEVFPEPRLTPSDPYARAVMRRWAKIPDDEIHAACALVSQGGVLRLGRLSDPQAYLDRIARDPITKRAARNRRLFEHGLKDEEAQGALFTHVKLLEEMEDTLSDGRPFLVGEAISLADIGVTPYINRLNVSGLAPMWADKPNLAAWFARIQATPAYDQAYNGFKPRFGNAPIGDRLWNEVEPLLRS